MSSCPISKLSQMQNSGAPPALCPQGPSDHLGRWLEAPRPLCFMTLTSPSVLRFLVAYPVMCLLPSAHGPCTNWTTRWYFVAVVGKCNRFWYGGCHGNKNSFASEEECMRVCRNSVGVSPLEHQPSSGTGALQRQHTGSRSHTGDAQGPQQPPLRESASHSQEGRAYVASHPTQDSHRQDSWRSEVPPESLPRTAVLESQLRGTQQSRWGSLSQRHWWETAMPGPSQRQSSSAQQVPAHEGKQWHKAFGADVSMTEGFGHQVSADSFPARTLHR